MKIVTEFETRCLREIEAEKYRLQMEKAGTSRERCDREPRRRRRRWQLILAVDVIAFGTFVLVRHDQLFALQHRAASFFGINK